MNRIDIQVLKTNTGAQIVSPEDAEYAGLQNSFNRTASPALIVRCADAAQVAEAVAWARQNNMTLSVRGGGHGFHGKSTNNGGMVIDLGPMRHIAFTGNTNEIVRVGAGARWGEVAGFLGPHGRAITSGDTKQVGVGGLTLAGGIGWMVRKYGLTIDSLVAADIVTADGSLLRVEANEHPDLFWAISGGGGNFGVVTAFEFRTQAVERVFNFEIVYDVALRESVLEDWGRFMRTAPDELSSSLTLFPGIIPVRPQPELRISSCHAGDEASALACYEALSALATPISKDFTRIAYAGMLHDAPPKPPALRSLNSSAFVPRIDGAFAKAVADNGGQPGKPLLQVRALGGAMNRVARNATAFAHRDAEAMLIAVQLAPPDADEAGMQSILDLTLAPFAPYIRGAYINFCSDTGPATVEAAYPGETLAKLARVKYRYDPDNAFRQNHNIVPNPGPA